MLSTWIALLGALGGGALRIIPTLIDAWLSRGQRENAVELARIDLAQVAAELENRLEIAKLGPQNIEAEARAVLDRANAETIVIAQQAQAQLTGVPWADALNISVRPMTTYLMLLLFLAFKLVVIGDAIRQSATVTSLVPVIWNDNDEAIFAGVITFWFADSILNRRRQT